jgi:hypothetical protein
MKMLISVPLATLFLMLGVSSFSQPLSRGAANQISPDAASLLQHLPGTNQPLPDLEPGSAYSGFPQMEKFSLWSNNAWVHTKSHYYTYDVEFRIAEELITEPNGDPYRHCEYTYDSVGHRTHTLIRQYVVNSWVDYMRFTAEYDNNGLLALSVTESNTGNSWDTIAGVRWVRTYDLNAHLISVLQQNWIDTFSGWVNNDNIFSTYSPTGFPQTSTILKWENGAWVGHELYEFTCDSMGVIREALVKVFSGSLNSWVEDRKIIGITWYHWTGFYLYSQKAFEVVQRLAGGQWVDFERINTGYDSCGSKISLVEEKLGPAWHLARRHAIEYDSLCNPAFTGTQLWNGSGWNVEIGDDFLLSYSPNSELIEKIHRSWVNGSPGSFMNMEKHEYFNFWNLVPLVSAKNVECIVFPNPSEGRFLLRITDEDFKSASLVVYSLAAHVLHAEKIIGTGDKRLDLSLLPKGMYVIKIAGKTKVYQEKIVIR